MQLTLATLALLLGTTSTLASSNLRYIRQRQADLRHQFVLEHQHQFKLATATARKSSWLKINDTRATAYAVDGSNIPLVDFDAGPSWSGLIPISGKANETRKLFFWFWPAKQPSKDLIFWTNGGPGCSSLKGFLQENGPISWKPGTAKPVENTYSWTDLANVLWVEQPVGTGYSQGVPNIHNNDELAAQVAGFLKQFFDIFKEMQQTNFFVTGESYAGLYVPYIANYIYEHPKALPIKMKGTWLADPVIADDFVTEYVPAVPFMNKWKDVLALNASARAKFNKNHAKCGYKNYYEKYLVYPPAGVQPIPPDYNNYGDDCYTFDDVFNAAILVNPAFNIYRVTDMLSVLWDVTGFPGSYMQEQTKPLYFNRADVKKALHANPNTTWQVCSEGDVYVKGQDNSLPSIIKVLPNVIEKSPRTVIVHGLLDMVLIAEGTRLGIQNMTWNGKLGFQKKPAVGNFRIDNGLGVPFDEFDGGQDGITGSYHTERNLTYVEINLSGHETPQFAPATSYKTIQYLLGQIDNLD